MLGHKPFYHGLIKKYILVMGKLFSTIEIERTNPEGDVTQLIRVPVVFGDKDPWLTRSLQDPELNKETALQLPRMSFIYTDYQYYPASKINPRGMHALRTEDANHVKTLWNEVPYEIFWSLFILTSTAEDGAKIVEQILPWFTPDWNQSVELIPEMNLVRDIPITLLSVNPYPHFDGQYTDRRIVGWELKFSMKAPFLGPVVDKKIIKFTTTELKLGTNVSDAEMLTKTVGAPGLTANGEPTRDPDESIDPLLIKWNDPWGFTERHSSK